jgi:hypothetical protein
MKNLFVLGGLACALLAIPALAKERTWQTGKVTEISNERFGVGNGGKLAAALGQQHATHDKGVEYTIQAGEFSYVAVEMSMAHHRLKDQRVELNDTVKFALDGETKLILMGNDNKERTLQLLKRTQRANPAEQAR